MGYIEDAQRLMDYAERLKKAGAETAQNALSLPPTVGIFSDAYPEWTADNGLEKAGHLSRYKGIVYKCINDIYRYETYAPDLATNNYNPYPEPDSDGVFPYVYGMGIEIGMKIKGNDGNIYEAIQAMTKQINPPEELPAIFKSI